MNNKIIYHDTAPGAEDDARFEITDVQPFAMAGDMIQRVSPPKTATLENDYWELDGTFELLDDSPEETQWGLWSRSMSDINGIFASQPTLEISFAKNHSSVGISFDFAKETGDYCNQLTIKWYRNAVLLGSEKFYPTAVHYACIRKTENYNRLVISFEKTNKPYRYLRVHGILFGMERIFESDELQEIDVLEELNPAGIELSVNTLHFGLRSKSDVPFMFQKKQPIYHYHKEQLMGMFFMDKSKRLDVNQYEVDAVCAVGTLDESDFMGGIYTGQSTGAVAAQIAGGGFIKLEIDPAIAAVPVRGYLPICTKREALEQLAFASCAAISPARSKTLKMYPLPQLVSVEIGDDRIFYGVDIDIASIVTGIEVVAHSYAQSQEVQELYKGTLTGTSLLTFSEPMHSLSVTGGTISESGTNYARVTANGAVTLTGKKFTHTTKTTTISNPQVSAADLENVKKIETATLVGGHNVDAVSQNFWKYVIMRTTVNGEIILKDERVGDLVKISTPFQGVLTGRISSLDISADNSLVAKAVIDCD